MQICRRALQGESSVKALALHVPGLSSYLWQSGEKLNFASRHGKYYLCPHLQEGQAPLTSKAGGMWAQAKCFRGTCSGRVGKQMFSRMLMICPYLGILISGTARTETAEIFPGIQTLFTLQ